MVSCSGIQLVWRRHFTCETCRPSDLQWRFRHISAISGNDLMVITSMESLDESKMKVTYLTPTELYPICTNQSLTISNLNLPVDGAAVGADERAPVDDRPGGPRRPAVPAQRERVRRRARRPARGGPEHRRPRRRILSNY